MMVAQSPVSHQAAADALPMRDTIAVLFFVSVGMLFAPAFNPLLFRSLGRAERRLKGRPRLWSLLDAWAERNVSRVNAEVAEQMATQAAGGSRLAVVVGFGPVERTGDRLPRDAGPTTVVIDMTLDTLAKDLIGLDSAGAG